MSLEAGARLGPYEVLAPLGAGGMGEVYRARDAKLGREIAVKVLPDEFAENPEKLARFEREARLLASLNHTGIATLYGVEQVDRRLVLAMELVEGETLAERLSRGAVPVDEALPLALQIAEALEAAHEKGVIHRDLKPSNIKIAEGNVKVLDFGLAKALADDAPESDLSQSPTLSRDSTEAGVILGTAVYMSPEQARGKVVDKRTDIFSFGAVLYEMLTGRKAFPGEDVGDVLAAVIRSEPNWQALPTRCPSSLAKLLRRCLVKERKSRLQAIGDVRLELQEMLAEPAESVSHAAIGGTSTTRLRQPLLWGLLGAVLAGITVWVTTRPGPAPVARLAVTLPPTDQLSLAGGIALSPDGRDLVYVATRDGMQQLHRRSMDALDPVPIRGTENAARPFFSPGGDWVGFFADGKLKKVPLGGGPSVTLCDALGGGWGASWGQNDAIVFGEALGLARVSASGGTPEQVTTLEGGEVRHQFPAMLPSGRAVLFSVYSGSTASAQIAVLSLETGERAMLEDGTYLRYSPTGHIVFARGDALWAVPFDADALRVRGTATPILEGVPMITPAGFVNFTLSSEGSLAYVPGLSLGTSWFVWVDREGTEERATSDLKNHQEFTLSTDGSRIAVRVSGAGHDDIWTYDLQRGTSTRLTFDRAGERFPLWTPDGQRVAFGGAEGMFWKAADGTGDLEPITESPSHRRPEAFSPDGRLLVYQDLGSGRDLGMVKLDGERSPTPLLTGDFLEMNAALSPDGSWLAYSSTETGVTNIYVRPFPDVNVGKWQVSSEGGMWPLWAPDGRELFYRDPQSNAMMTVSIQADPTFALGRREPLFSMAPYFTNATARRVAIHPDGQRFLLLKNLGESEAAAPPHIVIVQNWHHELERLVPTD